MLMAPSLIMMVREAVQCVSLRATQWASMLTKYTHWTKVADLANCAMVSSVANILASGESNTAL